MRRLRRPSRRPVGQVLYGILAVQAQGQAVTTIEGLGTPEKLHPMQAAFNEHHGLQCGFCTPGMIMSAVDFAKRQPGPDRASGPGMAGGQYLPLAPAIRGNIVASVEAGARAMARG